MIYFNVIIIRGCAVRLWVLTQPWRRVPVTSTPYDNIGNGGRGNEALNIIVIVINRPYIYSRGYRVLRVADPARSKRQSSSRAC